MTHDQIIEWACKAGFEVDTCSPPWHKRIERFAALVAQHEREQCALVCEVGDWQHNTPMECATAIRARGEKP